MAELYRFFDSIDGEDERSYTADEFAEYFRQVISSGILNGGTNLQVVCSGTDMNVSILPGYAWLEGYLYKINIEPLVFTLDVAHPTQDRIDRVVIRLDKRLEHRYVKAFILKGTPAQTPVAPDITRDENIYELSLAQMKVIAGKSFIEGGEITDERLNTSVCGLANSLVTADTTDIFNQFQAWYNSRTAEYQAAWNEWFTSHKNQYQGDWRQWWENNPVEFVLQWLTWWAEHPQNYEQQWATWWQNHPVDYQRRFEEWFTQQQTEGFAMGNELLLKTDILNTVQFPTYNADGDVVEIQHKRDGTIIRTDIFSYADDLIAETRALITGETLVLKHYFSDGNYTRTEVT